MEVLGQVLHARGVEGIDDIGRKNALLAIEVVVARDVARHARGRVRDDAVERMGGHEANGRKLIHGQEPVRITGGHAIFHDTRGRAMGHAHAVAQHDDHVLERPATTPGIDHPVVIGDGDGSA